MSKHPENKSSRRTFLKKTSAIAGITALGGSLPESDAANPNPPLKPRPRPSRTTHNSPARNRVNTTTKKLGGIINHPPGSIFNNQRRQPGWKPDTELIGANEHVFYPEEAIEKDTSGAYFHFPPPNRFPLPPPESGPPPADTRVEFEEPKIEQASSPEEHAAKMHEHHRWILGAPINESSPEDFDKLIKEVAVRVRRYNAALYWMRRLHFLEHGGPDTNMPPRNPHGDKAPVDSHGKETDHSTWNKRDLISDALDEWEEAVASLSKILEGNDPAFRKYIHICADMVEVNSYIVSMRIIAQEEEFAGTKAEAQQIGGSSSSHVYISSPFCSAGC